jgi:hypothetical protein
VTFLFETDKLDDLLRLRGLRIYLFILDLLGIHLLLDVRVKILEQHVLVVYSFDPNLVVIALIVEELCLELLLDQFL